MLISISVENFRSIRSKVTLDLTANRAIKDAPENLSALDNYEDPLLKIIALYGLNSAGKTTILLASFLARYFIINSAKVFSVGDKLSFFEPFLLDEESKGKPTTFDIVFSNDGVRYRYIFAATQERIVYETLHAYPNQVKQIWYERKYNSGSASYSWKFGHSFRGSSDHYKTRDQTLENVLFFSKSVMDNNESLIPAHNFFKDNLAFELPQDSHRSLTYEFFEQETERVKILNFLKRADLGFDEIVVNKNERNDKSLDLGKVSRNSFEYETKSIYRIPGTNSTYAFDFFSRESMGARKMFNLAGPIIRTLERGGVLMIDELEQSLHVKLMAYILKIFNSPRTNPRNAQLIFTTHSPTILEYPGLRRDQIWFASKSSDRCTSIYPLTEVAQNVKGAKTVRKKQDLIKGFLDGKFYEPPKILEDQLPLF